MPGRPLPLRRRQGRTPAALLAAALDRATDAVYLIAEDGRIVYANRQACRSLGRTRRELIGLTPLDIDPVVSPARLAELVAATLAGEVPTAETWHRTRDGQLFPVEVRAARVDFGGRPHCMVTARDISVRQRILADLKRTERVYRTLADNVPDNIARFDDQGRFLYINPALEKTMGRSAAAVLGTRIAPPYDLVAAAVAEVTATGRPATVLQPVEVDGTAQVHAVSLVPELDDLGRLTSVLAVGRDLTGMLRAQAAIAAREHEFHSLAESSPISIIRYDLDGRIRYFNQKLARDLEISPALAQGRLPRELWPDGRFAAIDEAVRAAIADGRVSVVEFWASLGTPEPHCHQVHLVPERDEAGCIVGALGFGLEVTEIKRAERELRMAASVFGAAREGIVITAPDGSILDVNPAFTAITGYDRAEVLGRDPRLLASGRHDPGFYDAMWRTLAERGSWSGEIVNRRKTGELYTERLDIVAVKDDRGNLKHYVGIFSDISLLKEYQLHLHHIAHHDALTDLPNRLLLGDRLTQAIAQARRAGRKLAVLYLDLDGFKPINDDHGHEVGDRVLVEIARRLQGAVRSGDTVARIGGDEFVVLLVGLSGREECEEVTLRLSDRVTQPIEVADLRLNLSASIGIAFFPDDEDEDADLLLRFADQAMYSAKSAGRNQFVFHHADWRATRLENNRMLQDLRQAIARDEIQVFYQPIIQVATGRVLRAEALARWNRPGQRPTSPAEFIPVAESGGLVQAIGLRVFRLASRVAKRWADALPGPDRPRINVNRSPREFFGREGVAPWLAHLADEGIPGRLLGVEITESLLLDDRPEVHAQLAQLRAAGLTVALDDFGTGYSSLSYLKKFEIDQLKIDRSFVRDVVADPGDRAIVAAVIAMARRLGIKVVAEGVETAEQAALLGAEGCDYAQGYWYARPMPEEEFLAFVLR